MQRKQNRTVKRNNRKSPSPKKNKCNKCLFKLVAQKHINHSLYRKYSYSQNHYYLNKFTTFEIQNKSLLETTSDSIQEEYLSRYHKINSRKIILNKIKENYKVNNDIPRIFHLKIQDILLKSYHRKRLLEYFKMAKSLGLKIDSINYSSFMLSINLNDNVKKKNYPKVLM